MKATTRTPHYYYALLDPHGDIWQGRIASTRAELYALYDSQSKSLRDGYRAKLLTVYY